MYIYYSRYIRNTSSNASSLFVIQAINDEACLAIVNYQVFCMEEPTITCLSATSGSNLSLATHAETSYISQVGGLTT